MVEGEEMIKNEFTVPPALPELLKSFREAEFITNYEEPALKEAEKRYTTAQKNLAHIKGLMDSDPNECLHALWKENFHKLRKAYEVIVSWIM